jgi:hypothetical protein
MRRLKRRSQRQYKGVIVLVGVALVLLVVGFELVRTFRCLNQANAFINALGQLSLPEKKTQLDLFAAKLGDRNPAVRKQPSPPSVPRQTCRPTPQPKSGGPGG